MKGAVIAIESAASQTFHWLSPVWRVPSAHTAYLIHSFSSLSSKQPDFHSKPLSSEATVIGLTTSCSWFFWSLQGGILEAPLTVSIGHWSHCAWGSLRDKHTPWEAAEPCAPRSPQGQSLWKLGSTRQERAVMPPASEWPAVFCSPYFNVLGMKVRSPVPSGAKLSQYSFKLLVNFPSSMRP